MTGGGPRGGLLSARLAVLRAAACRDDDDERGDERQLRTARHHDEPAARMEDAPGPELLGESLGREVALEDIPARAVIQHALLPLLGFHVVAERGIDDDELACDPARLGEEPQAVLVLEMAVEMARENPTEVAVVERQVERVADDEGRVRESAPARSRSCCRSRPARSRPPAGAASATPCRRRRRAIAPQGARRPPVRAGRAPRASRDGDGPRTARSRSTQSSYSRARGRNRSARS